MRVVVQRVSRAHVAVDGEIVSEIGAGMVVLLGVAQGDTDGDIDFLARKVSQLRIFNDENGQLNAPIDFVDGSFLVISQFTLHGDVRRGKRPSFVQAMAPDVARRMVGEVADGLRATGLQVAEGEFGADMQVSLINDGPVTFILEK